MCVTDPNNNTSRGPRLSIVLPKIGPQAYTINVSVEEIKAILDGEVFRNLTFW